MVKGLDNCSTNTSKLLIWFKIVGRELQSIKFYTQKQLIGIMTRSETKLRYLLNNFQKKSRTFFFFTEKV